MIDELFQELPFDTCGPSKAFRPYTQRTQNALKWAKQNALPIIGLALAVMI